jgi:sulfur-carrier protein
MLQILYFGQLRAQLGRAAEQVALPPAVTTVAELIAWLKLPDPSRIRAAIDQQFAGPTALIAGAREIALFPPVTGG